MRKLRKPMMSIIADQVQTPAAAPVQPVEPVSHVLEPDRLRQQPRDQRSTITARMKIRRSVHRSR